MTQKKSNEIDFSTRAMPSSKVASRSRRRDAASVVAISMAGFVAVAAFGGCGSSKDNKFSGSNNNGGINLMNSNGNSSTLSDGGNPNSFGDMTAITCSGGTNAACTNNSGCPGNASTSIVGTVYDPADVNPLYNITVYVPGVPSSQLPDLSQLGVQATIDGGAPFCSCDSFYPPIVADAITDANGHFVINDAPFGTLTLVVQTGKWRRVYDNVTITQCAENDITDKELRLPRNSSEGSLPDIAIATGGADTLECLPLRIGVDAAEYVGGNGGSGHIHIFDGYNGATTSAGNVAPDTGLWNNAANLEKNDVVLLSCEGKETVNPNQQALIDYANNGGRAFLSHYHYVWLKNAPAASNWNTLAKWQGSNNAPEELDDTKAFPGDVQTGFYEGAQMDSWLALTGALTAGPADGGAPLQAPATTANCPNCSTTPAAGQGQLPIWYARHNVTALTSPPATEWIQMDPTVTSNQAGGTTQYFSFDTPLGAAQNAEDTVCGRVVYSDLHVSGGPNSSEPPGCTGNPPDCYASDYAQPGKQAGMGFGGGTAMGGTVPDQCRGFGADPADPSRNLSPQERALEFMLFDLSSCLVPPNTMPPPPTPLPK